MNIRTLALLFGFALILSGAAIAETRLSGAVEGDWTRQNAPYILTGTTTVQAGRSLTVEAGVEVRAEGNFSLIVFGTLIAEGSNGDSIYFHPTPGGEAWGGLRLLNADSVSLNYCVIEKGRAMAEEGADSLKMGGNVYVWGGDVTIRNSRISQGRARMSGGGIALVNSSPEISNCLINENHSLFTAGGALFNRSALRINLTRFIANSAVTASGGAYFLGGEGAQVQGCIFWLNRAINEENGVGGALVIDGSNPQFRDCEFLENLSTAGGAVYMRGAATSPLFERGYFWGNAANGGARVGGAIYIRGGATPTIRYCRIVENNANFGGGIYVKETPRAIIQNNLFLRNAATRAGGAIGTAIDCGETPVTLTRCTFIGNANIGADGIAHTAYARPPEGPNPGALIDIKSSIVLGPTPFFGAEGRVRPSWSNLIPAFDGPNNSALDPMFYGKDSVWFVLSGRSPCIDSGDTTLAADPDGSRADRGWLHYPHNALDSLSDEPITVELTTIDRVEATLRLRNDANVPFYVNAVDRWEAGQNEFSINASRIADDTLLQAAAFAGGDFYIAGSGSQAGEPQIYRIGRDFNLRNSYAQMGGMGADGYLDLGSDGESVLYGGSDDFVIEFTTDGEFGQEFRAPQGVGSIKGIAADFNYSEGFVDFYIGGERGSIVRADAEMFEISSIDVGDTICAIGAKLNERAVYYVTETVPGKATLSIAYPEVDQTAPLFDIPLPDGYRAGGFEVTQSYRAGTGTLVGILKSESGDSDLLYGLDLYTPWLITRPWQKLLLPGEEVEWRVVFAGDQAPAGEYESHFFVTVNGYGEGNEIAARMISTQSGVSAEDRFPEELKLSQAFPNPFNGRTTLLLRLPTEEAVSLTLTDANGREIRRLLSARLAAGDHRVAFDASGLPSGRYFVRFNTANGQAIRAISLMK